LKAFINCLYSFIKFSKIKKADYEQQYFTSSNAFVIFDSSFLERYIAAVFRRNAIFFSEFIDFYISFSEVKSLIQLMLGSVVKLSVASLEQMIRELKRDMNSEDSSIIMASLKANFSDAYFMYELQI
jgi:hypothetical protein